jgi:four helix bundle protein
MKENVLLKKSYGFALDIVKFCNYLISEKREFILSKQLTRSGTSIGANVEEAIGAQSKKDFLYKLTISYKEARETKYWLRLLRDSDIVTEYEVKGLIEKVEELIRIIGSIQKTIKIKYNLDYNETLP